MTELDLYKFIHEHEIEYRWNWNNKIKEDDVVVWIPLYLLEEFSKMVKPDSAFEGGLDGALRDDTFAIWASDLCIYFGIDLKSIFTNE